MFLKWIHVISLKSAQKISEELKAIILLASEINTRIKTVNLTYGLCLLIHELGAIKVLSHMNEHVNQDYYLSVKPLK